RCVLASPNADRRNGALIAIMFVCMSSTAILIVSFVVLVTALVTAHGAWRPPKRPAPSSPYSTFPPPRYLRPHSSPVCARRKARFGVVDVVRQAACRAVL